MQMALYMSSITFVLSKFWKTLAINFFPTLYVCHSVCVCVCARTHTRAFSIILCRSTGDEAEAGVQAAMPRGHNATGPHCHRSYMLHQSYGSGSQCFLIYI